MDSDQKDSISGVGFGEQDDPSDLDSVWAGLALDTLDGGWGGGLPLASPASIAADFLPTPHSALADLEAFRGTEIVSPLPDDHATVFLAAVPPPPAQEVLAADVSDPRARGETAGGLAPMPMQSPSPPPQVATSSKRHAPIGQWLTPPQPQFPSSTTTTTTSSRRGSHATRGVPIAPNPAVAWPVPLPPTALPSHLPPYAPPRGTQAVVPGFRHPLHGMPPYPAVAAQMQQQGGSALVATSLKVEQAAGAGQGQGQGAAVGGPGSLTRDVSRETDWTVAESLSSHEHDLGGLRRQPYSCPDLSMLTSMALATTLDSPSVALGGASRASGAALSGGVDLSPLLHFTSTNMTPGISPLPMLIEQPGEQQEQHLSKLRAIVSCPDMLSGGPQAYLPPPQHGDDDRRQQRLAKNRAAARERRLKAKNQIETYEQEAAVLGASMAAVRAHVWGSGESREAMEALLGHDTPTALLTGGDSRQEIDRALDQLLKHLASLRSDAMLMEVLTAAVCAGEGGDGAGGGGVTAVEQADEAVLRLGEDLMRELQLAPAQVAALRGSLTPEGSALRALEEVEGSLEGLRGHAVQQPKGAIEAALVLVKGVLDLEQAGGLLSWSDNNRVAISGLPLPGTDVPPVTGSSRPVAAATDAKRSSNTGFVFERVPATAPSST